MKIILAALLLVGFSACDPLDPMVVPGDAGADVECQQWGVDGNGGRYCVSYEPDPCAGPWGCAGK
jgi:hypothetical protein